MIKYFVQIVVFGVLSVQLANAIQCYSCDSSVNKDCAKITKTSSIKPVECQPSVIRQNTPEWLNGILNIDFFDSTPDVTVPMICQKIVGTNEKGEQHVFRGCQIHGGKSNICEVTVNKAASEKKGIKIEACELCEEDGCNKSTQISFDIRLLVVVLLALFKVFF